MFWFEDPALQAAIDHQRANPIDPLPRPEDIGFGFLAWLLSQSQGPWPNGDDPAAHHARCRIAALIDRIPGLSDLEAFANARHRKPLGDSMADIRGELAARLGCRFEDVDRLIVRDAAAVLLHEPAPGPTEAPSGTEAPAGPAAFLEADEIDTNSRVEDELRRNPRATSKEIAKAIGKADQTVRRSTAWKERPERLKEQNRARPVRMRPLTVEMLAAIPSKSDDPAEIASARELEEQLTGDDAGPKSLEILEREYLESVDPLDKPEYFRLSSTEREQFLKAWELTRMP